MNLKKLINGILGVSLATSLLVSCQAEKSSEHSKNEEKTESCLPASQVSKSEIKNSLGKVFGGDLKVIYIKESPVRGIYQVALEKSGRRGIVYMDCDLKHVVVGSILDLEAKRDLTREAMLQLYIEANKEKEAKLKQVLGEKKFEELKKAVGVQTVMRFDYVDIKSLSIPTKGTVVYGNPNGKYTVYIISDPQCPFCAKLHEEMIKVPLQIPDMKFEIIFFPLGFHRYAQGISENIICKQNMEERRKILNKSFQAVANRDEESLKSISKNCENAEATLNEHKNFAKAVNLKGTPMIIFPNGLTISGYIDEKTLVKIINILRK